MRSDNVNRVRSAPWGRKKFYAPLPILSVLLVVAAVAAPGLLRTTFTFFDDGHLRISATVQNVVHASGPDGKVVGFVNVTNSYSFAILITAASAVITSGTITGGIFTPDAGGVVLTIPLKTPLTVLAGSSAKQQFSGSFTGSVLGLTTSASFKVQPQVTWFEVHSPTDLVGPFTYSATKYCPTPYSLATVANPDYWNTQCFT